MNLLLDEPHKKRKLIKRLSQQYGAKKIRVFGSVARGEETPESDIDFLVDFPRGYDLFKQRMPLADQLKKLLGRKIDLIPEHEVSSYIREQVFNEAVEL